MIQHTLPPTSSTFHISRMLNTNSRANRTGRKLGRLLCVLNFVLFAHCHVVLRLPCVFNSVSVRTSKKTVCETREPERKRVERVLITSFHCASVYTIHFKHHHHAPSRQIPSQEHAFVCALPNTLRRGDTRTGSIEKRALVL